MADEIHPVEEVRWAARRFFEALAQDRPLVLMLEDAHWAEQTLLDLLTSRCERRRRGADLPPLHDAARTPRAASGLARTRSKRPVRSGSRG